MNSDLKDFFIVVGPMRIDSDEFVRHPVVLTHVQGVYGRQTGLLVDTAVTWKNQNMLLLLLLFLLLVVVLVLLLLSLLLLLLLLLLLKMSHKHFSRFFKHQF